MEKENKSTLYRWMRALHRDIGFFVIGLTVIYCISGIMLTYRDTTFLKSETAVVKTIEPGLNASQLGRALHLRELKVVGEDDQEIKLANGTYNKVTGVASYQNMEIPALLRALNNLHSVSSQDARHWFTTIYAMLLCFLAVSSFWMYRPGSRYFKRGLILAGAGFAASFGLVLL